MEKPKQQRSIYESLIDDDTSRAFSNLEENINFKKVLEFMGKCLRKEESGCKQLREHIDTDRCIGRQQAIEGLINAANSIKAK